MTVSEAVLPPIKATAERTPGQRRIEDPVLLGGLSDRCKRRERNYTKRRAKGSVVPESQVMIIPI